MSRSANSEICYSAEALVALTWQCNLRCSYCFVREEEVMEQEPPMSPELGVRVMDALDEGLSEVRTIRVHFYGGEPFLNMPAAEAMVKRAQEKPGRFSFVVTTNGTVLSDALIDLLNAGKFFIVLSIDGPVEVHDECRRKKKDGSPSHQDVMRFLEAVRARTSCHVEGAAVIRSGTRLLHASQYLRSLPIDSVKAQLVRLHAGAPFALSKEERELYKQDLEAIGQTVIEELEAGKIPMDHRFDNRVLQLLIKENKVRFCEAGLTGFGVTPSGSVRSCLLVNEEDAVLGHVNDDPNVWREAGRKWRERPHRQKCLECNDFQLCAGGCPAIIPICGDEECDIIAKNCEVARHIFDHFQDNQEALLALAGII